MASPGGSTAFSFQLMTAAGIGEGTGLFGEAAGREAEDLGLDLRRVDVVQRAVVLPELAGLGFQRVHHDQELELGQGLRELLLVRHRGQRVEALHDETVHPALVHALEYGQHVVARVALGHPVVGKLVFRRRRGAVVGLHQAGVPLREVLREGHLARAQGLAGARGQVGRTVDVGVDRRAHVTRQHLGVGAHVGDALHVGVPAQRVDAAARPAHVAQQQLDHGHGADVLAAHRVLRPAQRIADRHHLVGRRGLAQHLRDLQELVLRRAGDLAHQLGRVAREVAPSSAGTRRAGSAACRRP